MIFCSNFWVDTHNSHVAFDVLSINHSIKYAVQWKSFSLCVHFIPFLFYFFCMCVCVCVNTAICLFLFVYFVLCAFFSFICKLEKTRCVNMFFFRFVMLSSATAAAAQIVSFMMMFDTKLYSRYNACIITTRCGVCQWMELHRYIPRERVCCYCCWANGAWKHKTIWCDSGAVSGK